jgi:hypothetical protein
MHWERGTRPRVTVDEFAALAGWRPCPLALQRRGVSDEPAGRVPLHFNQTSKLPSKVDDIHSARLRSATAHGSHRRRSHQRGAALRSAVVKANPVRSAMLSDTQRTTAIPVLSLRFLLILASLLALPNRASVAQELTLDQGCRPNVSDNGAGTYKSCLHDPSPSYQERIID